MKARTISAIAAARRIDMTTSTGLCHCCTITDRPTAQETATATTAVTARHARGTAISRTIAAAAAIIVCPEGAELA